MARAFDPAWWPDHHIGDVTGAKPPVLICRSGHRSLHFVVLTVDGGHPHELPARLPHPFGRRLYVLGLSGPAGCSLTCWSRRSAWPELDAARCATYIRDIAALNLGAPCALRLALLELVD